MSPAGAAPVGAGPVVRVASGSQVADAGALTAEAYLADRLLLDEDPYELELRDAARRAIEATLLVATVPGSDGGDVVVGTITLAPHGSSYAEVAEPGELELRMLAVAPEARGRGIAEELMRAAMRECVATGSRRVVLSTLDAMQTAQRLYARLGFVAQPRRDWGHDEVHLRVHTWTPPEAPGALVEQATWPPVRIQTVGQGWRVGLSGGLTRRANSALCGGGDIRTALDEVEQTYRAEGLPPIVRVGVGDEAVEAELDARGYRPVSGANVLVRDLDTIPEGTAPYLRVTTARTPDEVWLEAWLGVKSAGADRALAREVLTGAAALYLTAVRDGRVAGVIRVAFVEDWAALSALVVRPDARRAGIGRELTLRALVAAREQGASRAFLQVEPHNAGAMRLYAGLGFQPADVYRYREL